MTLEAGGAELEPGQAPEKGKTLREPARRNRGAADCTWSSPVWPVRGVSRLGQGTYGAASGMGEAKKASPERALGWVGG